jgi:hypothetical protein
MIETALESVGIESPTLIPRGLSPLPPRAYRELYLCLAYSERVFALGDTRDGAVLVVELDQVFPPPPPGTVV